jgi:hypothetical protein
MSRDYRYLIGAVAILFIAIVMFLYLDRPVDTTPTLVIDTIDYIPGDINNTPLYLPKAVVVYYNNDPRSFTKTGWKPVNNSNMSFVFVNNGNFGLSKMNLNDVVAQSLSAFGMYDTITSQKLFNNNMKVVSTSGGTIKNGINEISFVYMGTNVLAKSRTFLRGIDSQGRYIVVENDIMFNQDKKWTTSNTALTYPATNVFDYQTTLLHEIGHVYGLGDLYGLPSTDPRMVDKAEIMNSYDDRQRNLGKGDVAGIQTIYGK